ncbi:MAG: Zn-ribbon domain-containing OB-fold protein [Candidatus Thorarchaeota archaeon]
MSENPTIESYQKFIEEENFKAYKCVDCGMVIAPPSGTCYGCGSTRMEWTEVSGKGKLVSFTVIHVAPEEFQAEVPYYVGIVELEEGTRVTARLMGYDPEKPEEIILGTPVHIAYEHGQSGKVYLAFSPE